MTNTYDKGDLVRCTGTFTNASGTAIDPTAVTFKYKNPSGQTTTLVYGTDAALVKSAVGVYYVDINANAVGGWRYRFESTGSGQAAAEDTFIIRETSF